MKLLLASLLFASPALAQETCPAAPAGFDRPVPLAASPARRLSPLPVLTIGQATAVTLAPTAGLSLEAPSRIAAGPNSFGGMVELRVPLTGTYRIVTDGEAWVDLTIGGKVMPLAAETQGPDCGPIDKILDFALTPGTYTLQLSDSENPAVTLLATPVS